MDMNMQLLPNYIWHHWVAFSQMLQKRFELFGVITDCHTKSRRVSAAKQLS